MDSRAVEIAGWRRGGDKSGMEGREDSRRMSFKFVWRGWEIQFQLEMD